MLEACLGLIIAIFATGGIGAMIGSLRGRSVAGFWLGLVFGPLGWCIAFTLADRRPKCPACKGVIDPGSIRCPHCRYDLVQIEKRRATTCSFCGALVRRDALTCSSCGSELSQKRAAS